MKLTEQEIKERLNILTESAQGRGREVSMAEASRLIMDLFHDIYERLDINHNS